MNKKILISLMAIVVVAGAAVWGTTAYFSDTETSRDNTFTAGAIDLKVDNTSHYNGYICREGTWQCDPWADFIVEFQQGKRKDGNDVLPERSDPSKALGEAERDDTENFTSLGFSTGENGYVVLGFSNQILNGVGYDLEVVETSYGNPSDANYPETADVYASQDGSNWTFLKKIIQDDNQIELPAEMTWAKYIKIVDVSPSSSTKFPGTADGFDVDGVRALHCASEPANLAGQECALTWGMEDIGLTARKFFDFADIKPGDTGESTISLHLDDNPAYGCMHFTGLENLENELIEPEEGDTTEEIGELGENMSFLIWKDDGDNILEVGEDIIAGPDKANNILNQSHALALYPNPWEPGEERYIGVAWCAGSMSVDPTISSILCDHAGMKNEAQTDSMSVDVSFYVEQSRHNDGFSCVLPNPSPSPTPGR